MDVADRAALPQRSFSLMPLSLRANGSKLFPILAQKGEVRR